MKKFFLKYLFVLIAFSAIFLAASCSDDSTSWNYAVGDIILSDGGLIHCKSNLSLTDEEKSKAIAVIFKVVGSKAYGVGIKHDNTGLAWCLNTANGYYADITAIQCSIGFDYTGSYYIFAGDTDGSDNFAQIKAALGEDDDTGTLSNYPAFEFAINYKDKEGSNVKGTAYESGWYLPTVSELYDIYRERSIVDAALEKCGGSKFDKKLYLSSTECFDCFVDCLDFEDGYDTITLKDDPDDANVCCIRVFE